MNEINFTFWQHLTRVLCSSQAILFLEKASRAIVTNDTAILSRSPALSAYAILLRLLFTVRAEKKKAKVIRGSNNMPRSTLKPIKTSDNIGRASASSIHLSHSIPLSRRIRSCSSFYAVNDASRNS